MSTGGRDRTETSHHWVQRSFRAMGSPAQLIVGGDPARIDALADAAIAEIERLEQCWSRFRADSELNALHHRAGRPTVVSDALLLAFRTAHRLWVATSGAFDPTVRAALEALGYDRSFETVAPTASRHRPTAGRGAIGGFDRVTIDPSRSAITIPEGISIDLGGLGKGLAADLAAEFLISQGAASACVSLGGDIRVAGAAPGGAWSIPVEHPHREHEVLFHWDLAEGAIVTSTTRYRRWERDGRQLHHLIDPATGLPADRGVDAVVCAGASTAWAEGFAKAALVRGVPAGRDLLVAGGLTGWLFTGADAGAHRPLEEVA